jgi:hypothetical protein
MSDNDDNEYYEPLTERRAKFVYNAARLAAQAVNASIIPVPWDEREKSFKVQFRQVIERYCGDQMSYSPEELHDLVPYADLGQFERDKDAVFVALCEIARQWIYNT